MSFNNHDNDDTNRVRYVRETKFTEQDKLNGKAIKLYTMALTMPLSEFIKWFREQALKEDKQDG